MAQSPLFQVARSPSRAILAPPESPIMTPPKARAPAAPLPPSSSLAVARIVSPARSLSAARGRRRYEVGRGNQNALRHGIFGRVCNQVDVANEIVVTLAARPDLDPIADLRLVESYCLASVSYRRALEAIERDGMTPTLTSFAARFAQLEERQEARLFEREKARQAELKRGHVVDLSKYARNPEA